MKHRTRLETATPTMRRSIILISLLVSFSAIARADKKLTVNSDPQGARVEINGKYVGDTPLVYKVKDYVFDGAGRWVWSDYLNVPLQMTITKEGYVAKTLVITRGPLVWNSLNGQNHKTYYVVTSREFNLKLDKVGDFLGANPFTAKNSDVVESITTVSPGENKNQLSTEAIVQRALPAVVTVRCGSASGSGFFITDSVVVTNRHVVSDSQTATVVNGKGESFQSESIFIHPTKDLALIKVKGGPFPYLRIAEPASTNVGADVFAMGSPGFIGAGLLPNTVTKGVVSSFRKASEFGVLGLAGDVLLVQTDAAVNRGNSGGPLLNRNAEVVGVNTLGANGIGGVTGLNFSIFASEVLQMLKEHFNFTPQYRSSQQVTGNEATKERDPKASVDITSEPAGAEIYVDGTFNSSTPSKLLLSAGEHTIKVLRPGFKDWERRIIVETGSAKTLNAILEKSTPVSPSP